MSMSRSSYTDREKATIREALEAVKQKEHQRITEGFNQIDFTIGVLNSLLVAFTVGVYPQHFWILYVIEGAVLIPSKMWDDYKHKPLNQILYYLDYCWVMSFMTSAIFCTATMYPSLPDVVRDNLYMTMVGVGAGSLIGATVALPFVALVFHSKSTMAAVFIHLTPPILLYTFMYHAEEIRDSWPGLFHLNIIDNSSRFRFFPEQGGPFHLPFQGMGTVHGNAMALYFFWWILYWIWMLTIGLDLTRKHRHSKNKNGNPLEPKYDTVFNSTVRGGLCEVMGTVLWKRPKEESRRQMAEGDYELRDLVVYMSCHAIGIWFATTVIAYICCQSKVAYATIIWMLVILVVFRGSQRYTYWGTSMSSKALEKEFASILEIREQKTK